MAVAVPMRVAGILLAASLGLLLGAGSAVAPIGCGWGPYHVGEEVAFGRPVPFTVQVDEGKGYLVDCHSGVDAYFELTWSDGDTWVYKVWGQLGSWS